MDTCPTFQKFLKPLLMLASAGEINVRNSADAIADDFELSMQARLETTRSGNQRRYIDRTHWAATYLRQAGLLRTTRPGFVEITDEGIKVNSKFENGISTQDLFSLPAFVAFQERRGTRTVNASVHLGSADDALTPHDQINEALEEIEGELADTLLGQLQNSTPSFFEKVVLDLFLKMGYGSGEKQSGEVLGGVGDEGVDGLINQDALGLERIYFQAKRYQTDNSISAEAMRGFAGALSMKQASKGLFVTTSSFTKGAVSAAEKVQQRIVLIDGQRLSKLMIDYEVGCSIQKTLSIKKIDEAYFES